MNDKTYSTGWWGIPGDLNGRYSTKVHLEFDGKPACGSRLREGMEFQWCSNVMEWTMLECEHCMHIYKKKIASLSEALRK